MFNILKKDHLKLYRKSVVDLPKEPKEKELKEYILNNHYFPTDYIEFISHTNGCEGFAGQGWYVRFYSIEETQNENKDNLYPGFYIFGSDGGGERFAFKKEDKTIWMLPSIGDEKDTIYIGKSLEEFMYKAFNDKIFD